MIEETHRATNENGPQVVDGRLLWTSATGITSADTQSYGGCLRRWYFEKVIGRWQPPTKAMQAGTGLHTEIETRLKTGESLKSPLALAGGIFVPHPGNGLHIEKPIHFVTAAGINIYGHVDLYNTRGEYIDPQGQLQRDPSWSFEVKDWKTTADFQYAKSERELADNIQLNTYAEAGFRLWPDFEHARLTHVYFRTRNRPDARLVTIRRSRDEVGARWEYAEGVVRLMADAARESTADSIPANPKACTAYRICPHASVCSAYGKTSLDSLYSKIAADFQKESDVGLIANPQAPNAAAPAPDMRAQLAAEEAAMRNQVAQQQRPNLIDAWKRIEQLVPLSGRTGYPALGGRAAYEMGTARGYQMSPNQGFAGAGSFAGVQLMEVDHVYALLSELESAAQPPAPMPQQAPMQQPVQQQQYTPAPPAAFVPQQVQGGGGGNGTVIVMSQQPPMAVVSSQPVSFLPPDAPQSMPQLAQQQQAPEPRVAASGVNVVAGQLPPGFIAGAPSEAPKAGPGRPRKPKMSTPVQDAAPGPVATGAASPSSAGQPTPQAAPVPVSAIEQKIEEIEQRLHKAQTNTSGPTIVLVNARLVGTPSKSLADYTDFINAELSKRYSVNADGSPGVQDVRCAPKDSILAFGGWKGAVREVVKSGVGLEGLEGAVLHLDTFMDELNEAVADALRVVADKRGWLYIRAVRS